MYNLSFSVNLFLQFLHHDHVHHLLAWAVMCLVRWCLSLKFSPHTCIFFNIFLFWSSYTSLSPAKNNTIIKIPGNTESRSHHNQHLLQYHSLKTWQRSRSVLRFFSKLLLSLLLWWLRMWNTAEIEIIFSVQRFRNKLV